MPLSTRLAIALLKYVPGVFLLLLSLIVLAAFLHAVLTDQVVRDEMVVVLLLMAALWWLYTHVPHSVRQVGRVVWRTGKRIVRGR
jgi:hypothetical protein